MKRRSFFKAFAALAATAVVAPTVLAKIKPDKPFGISTEGIDWSEGVNFDELLNELTRHQSGEKIMFCGENFYRKLNRMAAEKSGDHHLKNMGIRMTNIRTHWGSWPVISSPHLAENQVAFMDYPSPPPFFQVLNQSGFRPKAEPKVEWTLGSIKRW